MALTAKREAFCQHIVDGMNQTEAYKVAGYSWETMLPETISNNAYKLVQTNDISTRITQLREAITAGKAWSFERGIEEVERNISLAREAKQFSAAGASTRDALKLSGLLTENPQEARIQITKVTVVLNPGGSGQTQLLETRVLEGTAVPENEEEGDEEKEE